MNRNTRTSPLLGPSGLLLAALLGWGTWSGCAEEDTVAVIVDPDASVGPFSDGDGGTMWQDEGAPASDLQDPPDAGTRE